MAYFLTIFYIALGAFQGFPLIKHRQFKELAFFLAFLCISLLYTYSLIYKWNIPSPDIILLLLFNTISRYIFEENY